MLFTLLLTLGLIGSVAYWSMNAFRLDVQLQRWLVQPENSEESFAGAIDRDIPFGTWQYGGSTAFAAIRDVVDRQIQQDIPNFQLAYTQDPIRPPSSGVGIQMLIEGRLAFAQASRPLTEEEINSAMQRGLQIRQIPVAYDAIVVVVHPSLQLSGLTIPQLVGIYT
ncbi:MAG: phosphate ABC transporter substrate-binding protein, partial [Leptolyngbyaceae cyanobacterium SM1_3_5]|nr:phosphate ABC transporter substrate-binding protein [Leptolyngbyaceae cyanobacterium SM1_3_5]